MRPAPSVGESALASFSRGPCEEVWDELGRGKLHPPEAVDEATLVSLRPEDEVWLEKALE